MSPTRSPPDLLAPLDPGGAVTGADATAHPEEHRSVDPQPRRPLRAHREEQPDHTGFPVHVGPMEPSSTHDSDWNCQSPRAVPTARAARIHS